MFCPQPKCWDPEKNRTLIKKHEPKALRLFPSVGKLSQYPKLCKECRYVTSQKRDHCLVDTNEHMRLSWCWEICTMRGREENYRQLVGRRNAVSYAEGVLMYRQASGWYGVFGQKISKSTRVISFMKMFTNTGSSTCVYMQIFNFRDGYVTTFRHQSEAYIYISATCLVTDSPD